MAPGLGFISGSSSSLEITIFSILFIVVYITFFTLCTNCFSQSPETQYHEEKGIPSSSPAKEKQEDQRSINRTSSSEHASSSVPQNNASQVPANLHTRSHTMLQCQPLKSYSHNRAESHGYFSQGMMPRLPDIPVFSVGSAGLVNPRLSSPPPPPPNFQRPRVHLEPAKQPLSQQQPERTMRDQDTQSRGNQSNTNEIFTDHTYSVPGLEVSEEHPYESISMGSMGLPSPSNEAAADQSESESTYKTVKESGGPAAGHSSTPFTVMHSGEAAKLGTFIPPPLAAQDVQCLTGPEKATVYAAVNRRNKTVKLLEFPILTSTIVVDEDDVTEEAAPPVPEKMFE